MSPNNSGPTSAFDIQGHRGARGLAPENTLVAFRMALGLGVDTLELDTVVSADQQVVVSHDPWMSAEICSKPSGEEILREEEQNYVIYGMPYEDVLRFDCGLRGHRRFPKQKRMVATKPLLRDVIRFAEEYCREHPRSSVRYNVETKSTPGGDGRFHPPPDEFVALIWQEVVQAGISDRFTLQSFDVRTLQEARRRDLPIKLSLLMASGFQSPDAHLTSGLEMLGFTPDVYSPDYQLVTPDVVDTAHGEEMRVLPWTVNDAADMVRLKAMGVDGLITDYPDVAVEVLR